MTNIPWEHEASLMQMTGAGEALVRRGVLHQLVGHFAELPPNRQRGLSIRVAGPNWTREFDEWSIRELAARPEYTGAYGGYDSETDPDEPDFSDAQGETFVEAGFSGSGRG